MPHINHVLIDHLPVAIDGGERLHAAMSYSLLNGGKRIRPVLVLAAAEACGAINAQTWRAAAAIEYVHAYSLIHDDLPAMDDDALRRGKPTCHIAFDEATAILAGDALQCAAFECLSDDPACWFLMPVLAKSAGARGMVVGQAIDLAAVAKKLTIEQLSHMHGRKTGALINASVAMGAMTAGATAAQLQALSEYAQAIGLAFQIQDDILDVTADTQTLGKQQGADIALNKPTYVSLLGLAGATEKALSLCAAAKHSIALLPNAAVLVALADYVITRKN
ncbi:MAG: farnesyl diphosphate synthase [Marinagarivorans sp.]|nr:farnesyl diphosphate synthase [Marinagarivorans sp.]